MGDQRKHTCVHFTGIQHDTCEAGIAYRDVNGGRKHLAVLPCLPNMPHLAREESVPCEKCRFPTEEEIAADDFEVTKVLDCIEAGVSPCCGAPLDEARVIRSGRHKGHGPRYCTKCKQLAFRM